MSFRRDLKSAQCSVCNTNDPFFDPIVTCEKSPYFDNLKQSGQWLNIDDSPKHFPKPRLHQQNIMVTVWRSTIGVIYYNCLEINQSITVDIYWNQFANMLASLQDFWGINAPILLHNNTSTCWKIDLGKSQT